MILSVKKTDRLFFDTFESMAAGAAEAALILEEMFRNGTPASSASYGARIKEIEHRCDVLIHELVKTLHRTFITPIDRERSPAGRCCSRWAGKSPTRPIWRGSSTGRRRRSGRRWCT